MARPKKDKNLPEFMSIRDGYYETRRPISDSDRQYFSELKGKKAVKVIRIGEVGSSKRPSDSNLKKHNKNLDEIEARIEAGKHALLGTMEIAIPNHGAMGRLYTPDQITETIVRWEGDLFRARYLSYCNGLTPKIEPFSNQRVEWSQKIAKLKEWLPTCTSTK